MIFTFTFCFVGKLKLQEIIPPCPPPCCHLTGHHKSLKRERPTDTSYNYCKTSGGKKLNVFLKFFASFHSIK